MGIYGESGNEWKGRDRCNGMSGASEVKRGQTGGGVLHVLLPLGKTK